MTIAAMVGAAHAIDDANTGYDQSQRWSFFQRPDGPIIPNGEGDCSAVCGAIARKGGYPIDLSDNGVGGRLWTGTWKDRAVAAGFTAIPFDEVGLAGLLAGDFVLGVGHIEFVPAPGQMFSANADEHGRATGGQAGDQTGREVYFKKAYIYSHGGWVWVLRPPADPKPKPAPAPAPKPTYAKPGMLTVDGVLGPKSIYAWQYWYYKRGRVSVCDGVISPDSALIRQVQADLNKDGAKLDVDGAYGPKTMAALIKHFKAKKYPAAIKALQAQLNKDNGY